MKYIFILLVSLTAVADDRCETSTGDWQDSPDRLEIKTDVPKWLEGATITITQKDGKSSSVPAELFKVVPRKQQFLVTKQSRSIVKTCKGEEALKNRFSFLAGKAPKSGLDVGGTAASVTVSDRAGLVGGGMYQRTVFGRFSIGAEVLSNKAVLGVIGVDF